MISVPNRNLLAAIIQNFKIPPVEITPGNQLMHNQYSIPLPPHSLLPPIAPLYPPKMRVPVLPTEEKVGLNRKDS